MTFGIESCILSLSDLMHNNLIYCFNELNTNKVSVFIKAIFMHVCFDAFGECLLAVTEEMGAALAENGTKSSVTLYTASLECCNDTRWQNLPVQRTKEYNKIFSGTQSRQLIAGRNRLFRNHLCPHHQGCDVTGYPERSLYTEIVPETSVFTCNQLTRLCAREDFIEFSRRENFKLYLTKE
jgi:hypothetical protein